MLNQKYKELNNRTIKAISGIIFKKMINEYVVLKIMENSKLKDFINKVNNLHLLY